MNQEADGDAVVEHNPRAINSGAGGANSEPLGIIENGSESSGCVSFDTVIEVEEDPKLTAAFEKQRGDWSARKKNGSITRKQSKESTSPEETKLSAWKTTSALSGKLAVRKKNDPLMTKFKFSLLKYNKALKTTTDGQLSLKYMHDKLVKLRRDLLQTGNYHQEELAFDSPNVKEVPAAPPSSDFLLTKNLRAKIKRTSVKAFDNEKKLEELKVENDDLKKQLFESKTAIDELKVLHMQATSKHQEALDKIEGMNKEVEMRNEETKTFNAKMSDKLSKLKSEYKTFQMENEICRKMVEEVRLDYNETLAKCKEASETWEAMNDRYVSQKQMNDAIVSDFVKLGVSYKKLLLAFEELMVDNSKLRERIGPQSGKLCKKSSSYRCFHRKGYNNHTSKQVPRQRRVAVQTSEIEMSPTTVMVGQTASAQYCGDGLLHQHCDKKPYQELTNKLEKDIEALREENVNHLEKHKLLIRQVLRLDKQCHLQHTENRRQLKLVDEMKMNSKHLEEEVTILRNKLAQAEARKCNEPTKKLPSDSSNVIVKNTSSKNVIPHSNAKKTWLKSFWSKDNKFD